MKKLSFFLMAMLMSVMSFAETELFTQTYPGSPSTYTSAYTKSFTLTTGDYTLTYTNVNNGQATGTGYPWTIIRTGSKNGASVATIASEQIAAPIAKVVINFTQANASSTNALYLEVSANSDFSSATKIEADIAVGSIEFPIATPAAHQYYKITIDQAKGSANGFNRFDKVVFYQGEAAGEDVETVAAPEFSVTEANFKTAFTLDITSEEGTTLKYTIDNTDPSTSATAIEVATNSTSVQITKSTAVKAIAIKGELKSVTKSKVYCYVNSAETAYTVAEAMEVIDAGLGLANELYVKGEISTIEKYDAKYGSITYWIKDEEGNKFECYSGLGLNKAKFTKKEDLVVGSKVVVCGVMKKFNTIYEFNYNNYIVSLELPVAKFNVTATAENGTVTGAGEYEENAEATLTATANEGYEFTCWTSGEDTVSTENPYTFTVTANLALVANFEKTAPTTETIYFINAKKWAKVNVYAWTTDPIVAWPGAAATKEAEQIAGYDVYSYTLNAGAAANVIFNDGSSQTPDLVWTAGKYYVIDMGWLTKEEAETKLAAPLPETWNIVGAAGLMGKDWDLNAAENAMTKQEDGTYKLEKKGITIVAGTYEYKAAKDHGWTVAVPQDGNQKLTISKSGIYDITFVLNVTAKKLTATATLKQAAVVIPTIVIAGDMNSWSQTKDKFTMSADSLTATFKATLAVKNYGFKMIVGGAWHSDGKTITRAANSTKFTGANSNTNSTLKADIAGEYLFTWEYATKTLTVTYPALPVKYTVTATVNPAETGTVEGAGTYEKGKTATLTATPAEGYEFTCWTVGEDTVSTANPYKFTVTADLALVANFELIPPTKYNVTVTAENGTVEGAGEYEENAEATLTATAAEGYEFVNWTVGDSIVSTENPYKFTVTADLALVANFKEVVKAIEVNVTGATASVNGQNIDINAQWNEQSMLIMLWQGGATQGFGTYAAEDYGPIMLGGGMKELTPTTEGVYADNGDGTFTFTCSATDGTTQYNITVTGNNPTQGGGDEEYPIIDDAITNLTFNLDEEPYSCMGGPSEEYGIELYLVLGEEDGMGTFTLTEASEIYVKGSPATFISGYLTDIDTSAPAANAVIVAKLPDGSTFEFHIAMSSTPVDATVIVVENATLAIDSTFLFNNPVSGDVYEYSLTMSGNWTDSTNTTYLVTVEFPVYDPATTEEQERLANIKVGDFAADDAPFLGMVEDFLTITNVNGVITAKGLVSGNGLAFDITISGSLAQDPSTGVDNINTTIAPVKVIENGQIFIISNGVKYNAQGAKL